MERLPLPLNMVERLLTTDEGDKIGDEGDKIGV